MIFQKRVIILYSNNLLSFQFSTASTVHVNFEVLAQFFDVLPAMVLSTAIRTHNGHQHVAALICWNHPFFENRRFSQDGPSVRYRNVAVRPTNWTTELKNADRTD